MADALLSLPQALTAAMKERGLTQQQLSEALGTTQSTLSAILRGIRTPTRATAARFLAFLKLPEDTPIEKGSARKRQGDSQSRRQHFVTKTWNSERHSLERDAARIGIDTLINSIPQVSGLVKDDLAWEVHWLDKDQRALVRKFMVKLARQKKSQKASIAPGVLPA